MSADHPTPRPTPSPEYLAAANSVENRTRKLFRLLDPPHDPPPEVQQRSREFIASVRWTLAKTMLFAPHQYVVRSRTPRHLRDAYDQLYRDSLEFGYRGRFGRAHHHYLNIDGWRYFSCHLDECGVENHNAACSHARLGVGCVINAALNDDLPPVQLTLEVE